MVRLRIVLRNLLWIGTAGLTIFFVFSTFFQWHRLIELFSHFKLLYLWINLALLLLAITIKQWKITLTLSVLAVLNLHSILIWSINQPQNELNGDSVKLLHANVYFRNHDYDKLSELISNENPDLIMLQEFNFEWQRNLSSLKKTYSHNIEVPRHDSFGIAVYSKRPLITLEERVWGDAGLPSIYAELMLEGIKVSLVSTHPLPPISFEYYTQRNQQIEKIIADMALINQPKIISGDFNLSFWSTQYQRLGLDKYNNTRKGFGTLPSWPVQAPLFYIPIDHILVSDELNYTNTKTGPDIGSDHLPVITEISLKRKEG
ncbi:endonuclease/exonuclease/phosphatase family protein [Pleionea sediminis]|uniref:endonuclease/exonuclease/phosphatase family protein n=1 Tax=Pleionea sediminis TaxID=2569479 RepID=UPI00118644DF|nr:endonuclease/exonuclease/phosphatase family protein [Pleionea sediminis]